MSDKILAGFKNGLITFFDELIAQFPDDVTLVIVRLHIADKVDVRDVMTGFIQDLLPEKDKITNKDPTLFNNKFFFRFGSEKDTNCLLRLFQHPKLGASDRDTIWKWFESFVFWAEKYQAFKAKERREETRE